MDMEKFLQKPVMGIIRGMDKAHIGPVHGAIKNAGLETIEITMNTKGASGIISSIKEMSKGDISVGAGTVLSVKDLDEALEAGAEFVVMPVYIKEVARKCLDKGIPFFPGAFTPQEVFDAWEGKAAMVKIFPADLGGPGYIRALKGPFDKARLMAVGGVSLSNVADFFASGAEGVAFGSSIFKRELIEKNDLRPIEDSIRSFVDKVVTSVRTGKNVIS